MLYIPSVVLVGGIKAGGTDIHKILGTTMKSPCVNKCGLNKDNWCVGCGRTVREIRIWKNASEKEQKEILAKISERLRLQEMRNKNIYNDEQN
jgi:predicted Fe-S protein YdhL (DUF1289 family)